MWYQKLNDLKNKSNMTNESISSASGVPLGTVNKIFAGVSKAPSISNVSAIVHSMGFSLDDIDDNQAPAKESQGLDEDESELLTLYRSVRAVSPDDAEIIIQYARCVDRIAGVGLSAARKQAELASDFYDALRQERRG